MIHSKEMRALPWMHHGWHSIFNVTWALLWPMLESHVSWSLQFLRPCISNVQISRWGFLCIGHQPQKVVFVVCNFPLWAISPRSDRCQLPKEYLKGVRFHIPVVHRWQGTFTMSRGPTWHYRLQPGPSQIRWTSCLHVVCASGIVLERRRSYRWKKTCLGWVQPGLHLSSSGCFEWLTRSVHSVALSSTSKGIGSIWRNCSTWEKRHNRRRRVLPK